MPEHGPRGKKGQSLWTDAWRRLRRNWFAMGGLVVVVVMAVVALAADWIIPYQPDYGQPWLRAQPPGFSHPAVLAENRFEVGRPPPLPETTPDRIFELFESDGTVRYRIHVVKREEYRIRLRRGNVRRIQRLAGAERIERLEVTGEDRYVQVLGGDAWGPRLRDVVVVKGEPVPAGVGTSRQLVVLRAAPPAPHEAP